MCNFKEIKIREISAFGLKEQLPYTGEQERWCEETLSIGGVEKTKIPSSVSVDISQIKIQ